MVALAEVGKGKTWKITFKSISKNFWYAIHPIPIHSSHFPRFFWFQSVASKSVSKDILVAKMFFINLAALNVGEALDGFFNLGNFLLWLKMVGDQGKIEAILSEAKLSWHHIVSEVFTLVSVSIPLSNTLLWILKACLKKQNIVNKLSKTADDDLNNQRDHEDQYPHHVMDLIFPCDVNCLTTFSASEATSSMSRTQFSFEQCGI